MLLYKDGNFMQLLEGPEESVSALLARIERDGRHRGMIVLNKKSILNRKFPEWSMAFKHLDDDSLAHTAGYSSFLAGFTVDESLEDSQDPSHKLLLHFRNNIR